MMLSIPNASSNKLFDAQPSQSAAAPSIVIQPIVMYVSSSASCSIVRPFGGSPSVFVVYADTREGAAVEIDRVIPRNADACLEDSP